MLSVEFEEIESIEFLTETADVYDLSVDDTHNFFANGICVHNCGEATLEDGEPCVSYDTSLITKDGLVTIGDVCGKEIEIWNGKRWSKVTPRLTGTNRDLYRVMFSDGSSLDCTANHKFKVMTKLDKDFKQKRLDEIELDKRYPVRLAGYSMVNTNTKVYENAYTLGTAFGDGWLDGNDVFVGLYKSVSLPAQGKRYKTQLKWNTENSYCTRVKTDIDPELFKRLRSDDFSELFTWSKKSALEFIAGCLDTDGTQTNSKTVRLYLSGQQRAKNFQILLTKNGIASTISLASKAGTVTNKGTRKKDLFYITITDCSEIKCHRLDTSGGHKPSLKGKNITIKSIIKLEGKHDTYCFEEPEEHMGVFNNVLTYQCNLQEIALSNLKNEEEFIESSRLMHRWGKRVTMEKYHQPKSDAVVKRNRRVGTGITGCLQSELFKPEILDRAYAVIQDENINYSKFLGIPESIRTTVIKPSGTISKVFDCYEGIHPAYSRYIIQRVRFAASDPLIPLLKEAGHYMEPTVRFDGSLDHNTLVVDFYVAAPEGAPVADEDWTTWKQLDVVKMAQKHWSDQAVSVTVYYRKEEIPQLKVWLGENLKYIKSLSFLCHSEHGFKQAPKETINKEQYEKLSSKIKPIRDENVGDGELEDSMECGSGFCPVK